MFGADRAELRKLVEEAVALGIDKAVEDVRNGLGSLKDIAKLKSEIEKLTIEKDRREEEFKRREREVEHKVGLERERQKFETEQAKREATVAVREENLKADRERFEAQLKFHEERFTSEVTYLKEIIGDISDRLPTMEIKEERGGRLSKRNR